MTTVTNFITSLEDRVLNQTGMTYTKLMVIEDFIAAFGWAIFGVSLATYIWAWLITQNSKHEEDYRDILQDEDFAALRLVRTGGKSPAPALILKGKNIFEVIDAILSYLTLYIFPKRYAILPNRLRAKKVFYALWIITVIAAIIGIILTLHVSPPR